MTTVRTPSYLGSAHTLVYFEPVPTDEEGWGTWCVLCSLKAKCLLEGSNL